VTQVALGLLTEPLFLQPLSLVEYHAALRSADWRTVRFAKRLAHLVVDFYRPDD